MAIGRYDPITNKVDWLLGTGQERTHMVLVSKDVKSIFTSNVSSNTISIIERTEPPQGRRGGFRPGAPVDRRQGDRVGRHRVSAADRRPVGRTGHRQEAPGDRRKGDRAGRHLGGLEDRREVGRAGNKPSSRSAEVRRASTSRQMARKYGRPTWETAMYPSLTLAPRKSSVLLTPARGAPTGSNSRPTVSGCSFPRSLAAA